MFHRGAVPQAVDQGNGEQDGVGDQEGPGDGDAAFVIARGVREFGEGRGAGVGAAADEGFGGFEPDVVVRLHGSQVLKLFQAALDYFISRSDGGGKPRKKNKKTAL